MTKEIELRAFRKYPKQEMYYFTLSDLIFNRFNKQPLLDYSGIRDSIMQYTGLKDINEKKIYSGDIIKLHLFTQELGPNLGVMEGEEEIVGEIAIEPMGVWFAADTEEDSGYLLHFDGLHEESFEIIGNKHQGNDEK